MDETVIMNEQANVESNNETMPNEKRRWKQVVVGGVSGILMGTVSSAAYAATSSHLQQQADVESEQNAEESANDVVETQEYIDGVIPVAEVDDSMSFGEAFAAAREQVGPGGVFVWHGQLYGTYTAAEWNSMTPAEHAEFGSHLNIVYDESGNHDVVDNGGHDNNGGHVDNGGDTDDVVDIDPIPAPNPDSEPDSEHTVEVLSYGTETLEDGSTVNVAVVSIDGEVGNLYDFNNDQIADVYVSDLNHDGQISENEMADLADTPIPMPTVDNNLVSQNDPDYINDGNIDSYV